MEQKAAGIMHFNSSSYGFVLEKAFYGRSDCPGWASGCGRHGLLLLFYYPAQGRPLGQAAAFLDKCSPQASRSIASVIFSIGANDDVPSLPKNVVQ